jgi:hypothetical protein
MRRRRINALAAAATAALVIVAGVLALSGDRRGPGRSGRDGSAHGMPTPALAPVPPRPVPTGGSVSRSSPGPTRMMGGVPMGWRPGLAGAVSAATAITQAEPALVASDAAAAERLVDAWAAPAAAPALEAAFVAQRDRFEQAPGGPYSFDVAALAEQATSTAKDSATVRLWCVEVIFERAQPAYSQYLTEQLRMAWVGGDWRLEATSDTPGPSVALGAGGVATPPAEAAAALGGFVPAGPVAGGMATGGDGGA